MWREWIDLRKAEGAGPREAIFNVPDKLVNILNRDLQLAGIDKADELGRTVDVHALRHTFCTLLSKSGALPKEAQLAMRHSSVELTMQGYTDPRLFDVAGAVEKLPDLLPHLDDDTTEVMRATGTDDRSGHQSGRSGCRPEWTLEWPPKWTPPGDQSSAQQQLRKDGQPNSAEGEGSDSSPRTAEKREWRRRGSNPQPPACKAGALPIELRPRVVLYDAEPTSEVHLPIRLNVFNTFVFRETILTNCRFGKVNNREAKACSAEMRVHRCLAEKTFAPAGQAGQGAGRRLATRASRKNFHSCRTGRSGGGTTLVTFAVGRTKRGTNPNPQKIHLASPALPDSFAAWVPGIGT